MIGIDPLSHTEDASSKQDRSATSVGSADSPVGSSISTTARAETRSDPGSLSCNKAAILEIAAPRPLIKTALRWSIGANSPGGGRRHRGCRLRDQPARSACRSAW
jgi:hypothetical protein